MTESTTAPKAQELPVVAKLFEPKDPGTGMSLGSFAVTPNDEFWFGQERGAPLVRADAAAAALAARDAEIAMLTKQRDAASEEVKHLVVRTAWADAQKERAALAAAPAAAPGLVPAGWLAICRSNGNLCAEHYTDERAARAQGPALSKSAAIVPCFVPAWESGAAPAAEQAPDTRDAEIARLRAGIAGLFVSDGTWRSTDDACSAAKQRAADLLAGATPQTEPAQGGQQP